MTRSIERALKYTFLNIAFADWYTMSLGGHEFSQEIVIFWQFGEHSLQLFSLPFVGRLLLTGLDLRASWVLLLELLVYSV